MEYFKIFSWMANSVDLIRPPLMYMQIPVNRCNTDMSLLHRKDVRGYIVFVVGGKVVQRALILVAGGSSLWGRGHVCISSVLHCWLFAFSLIILYFSLSSYLLAFFPFSPFLWEMTQNNPQFDVSWKKNWNKHMLLHAKTCLLAKTQLSLGICIFWSGPSLSNRITNRIIGYYRICEWRAKAWAQLFKTNHIVS